MLTLLAGPGVVWELTFGSWVLLKRNQWPESGSCWSTDWVSAKSRLKLPRKSTEAVATNQHEFLSMQRRAGAKKYYPLMNTEGQDSVCQKLMGILACRPDQISGFGANRTSCCRMS